MSDSRRDATEATRTNGSGQHSQYSPFSAVVDRLRDEGVEFFVNSQLEPTIAIPEDHFQREWPVDSRRAQDYVVSLWCHTCGGAPKPNETKCLFIQLREECRRGGRRLSEADTLDAERNPIIQAIMALMNDRDSFDERTAVLLQRLRRLQEEGLIGRTDRLPAFTNTFSRCLKRLTPVLRGVGVEVTLRHTEDGSYCRLQRLASFQVEKPVSRVAVEADGSAIEPSAGSSGATAKVGTDLCSADASDGEIRVDTPVASAHSPEEKPDPSEGQAAEVNQPSTLGEEGGAA